MTVRSQALATVVTNPQSTQPLMLASDIWLHPAYVGTPWTASIWGVGGSGGYGYSSTSVPAWVTATPTTVLGVTYLLLTGTPTAGGSGYCMTTVTDSSTTVTTKSFRVNVNYAIAGAGGQLSVNAVPPPAYTNNPYSLDLTTYLSNPTLPLTSTVLTSGTLPTGMTLHSATGIVDASSVTGTTQNCVFTITDGASAVAVLHLQLRVKPGLSATTYAPAGVIGQAYQGKVTVSGGSGKYSVQALAANPLPTGLAVDAKSGNITGQPTALTPTTGAPTTHFQITDLVTGEVIITTVLSGGSKNVVIGSGMPPAASGQLYATDPNGAPIAVDAVLVNCGDGSDGDVTIDGTTDPAWCPRVSGINVAIRDGYCHNLTVVAGGELNMAGYDLYGTGTLTLDNAPANAINNRAKPFTPATFGTFGGAGGSGSATNGGNGTGATSVSRAAGGTGSTGGTGGHGTGTNTGDTGGTTSTPNQRRPRAVTQNMLYIDTSGLDLIWGGTGGGGGGGGGGNGTLVGTNGGSPGGGGGILTIRFRKISRNASTAVGAINVNGSDGSNSSNAGSSGQASGGGGGAGAGGYLRVYYGELVGSTATNALTADGGKGGNAGSIVGGVSVTAGVGADGAKGGCIILCNMLNGTSTIVNGASGSAHSGVTGGAGGTCRSNL